MLALIGVSNTLSLSVIERTRENAMLRAIGLTRGQLRGMLAVEALLISGIAAVLGTLLGITCGVLGAVAIFNAMGGIVVDVPWLWLLVVIGVSLGGGLVASIGPAPMEMACSGFPSLSKRTNAVAVMALPQLMT